MKYNRIRKQNRSLKILSFSKDKHMKYQSINMTKKVKYEEINNFLLKDITKFKLSGVTYHLLKTNNFKATDFPKFTDSESKLNINIIKILLASDYDYEAFMKMQRTKRT